MNKVADQDRNNHGGTVKARCANCQFRLGYCFDEPMQSWVPSKFVPHNSSCKGVNVANKPHSLSAAQVAPVLYNLLKANPKLKRKTATARIEEYLLAHLPSDYFVGWYKWRLGTTLQGIRLIKPL